MRNRTDEEMIFKLLPHLHGHAFELYYETFAANGIMKPTFKVYATGKR